MDNGSFFYRIWISPKNPISKIFKTKNESTSEENPKKQIRNTKISPEIAADKAMKCQCPDMWCESCYGEYDLYS